jgi:hypothetical protein
MFVFRWLTRDCFWAGQGLEASVIRSEIRSTAELNCALPLFLHPSHQRDTAHRPIDIGPLRARRRFGYWGEQIGHLRDRPRPIKSTSPASIASFMALLLRKPPVTMRHLSDLADFGGKLDEKSFPFYGAFCTAVFAFVLEREAEDLRLFD